MNLVDLKDFRRCSAFGHQSPNGWHPINDPSQDQTRPDDGRRSNSPKRCEANMSNITPDGTKVRRTFPCVIQTKRLNHSVKLIAMSYSTIDALYMYKKYIFDQLSLTQKKIIITLSCEITHHRCTRVELHHYLKAWQDAGSLMQLRLVFRDVNLLVCLLLSLLPTCRCTFSCRWRICKRRPWLSLRPLFFQGGSSPVLRSATPIATGILACTRRDGTSPMR